MIAKLTRPFANVLLCTLFAATPALLAQDESETTAAAPPVTLESIEIQPASPAADTLCQLSVKLKNSGPMTASQLGFTVKINGQELIPYKNQLYMFPLEAGATSDLDLYNFWSTETSRPTPANGKLVVEVILNEARWMTIAMEDDVEVWTPGDAVPGFPVSRSVELTLAKTAAP